MPNRKTHITFAVVVGLAKYLLDAKEEKRQVTLGELILVGNSSMLAGALPDIIEPPTNPNHRSTWHSLSAGGSLVVLWQTVANSQKLTSTQKSFIKSILAAYGSHLMLDACTPRSLPLI